MQPKGVRLSKCGGYWRARWYDDNGVRRSRSLGHTSVVSKSAALRLCHEVAEGIVLDPWSRTPRDAPSLAQWADQYRALRRSELRPAVIVLHDLTIAYLTERFGAETRIDAVTKQDAAEFRAWLASLTNGDKPRMTDASVCLHVRNARVIFQRAVDVELIPRNPFVKVRGTPAAVAKDWHQIDAEQTEKILAACPNDGYRALFALCRWAALRRGEAMRLTWADIDWESRSIRVLPEIDDRGVRRETTKQKARSVPIRPELYTLLRAGFEAADPGQPGPCDVPILNIHRNANAIIKRAIGATYAKPFHTLRKCCISEWAAIVMPATLSAWSGDRIETLMQHYVRASTAESAKVTGPTGPKLDQNATLVS